MKSKLFLTACISCRIKLLFSCIYFFKLIIKNYLNIQKIIIYVIIKLFCSKFKIVTNKLFILVNFMLPVTHLNKTLQLDTELDKNC